MNFASYFMLVIQLCINIQLLFLLLFYSYRGWWFGQKENGTAGFFERAKAIETDDDDDQGKLQVCLLFVKCAG